MAKYESGKFKDQKEQNDVNQLISEFLHPDDWSKDLVQLKAELMELKQCHQHDDEDSECKGKRIEGKYYKKDELAVKKEEKMAEFLDMLDSVKAINKKKNISHQRMQIMDKLVKF